MEPKESPNTKSPDRENLKGSSRVKTVKMSDNVSSDDLSMDREDPTDKGSHSNSNASHSKSRSRASSVPSSVEVLSSAEKSRSSKRPRSKLSKG